MFVCACTLIIVNNNNITYRAASNNRISNDLNLASTSDGTMTDGDDSFFSIGPRSTLIHHCCDSHRGRAFWLADMQLNLSRSIKGVINSAYGLISSSSAKIIFHVAASALAG